MSIDLEARLRTTFEIVLPLLVEHSETEPQTDASKDVLALVPQHRDRPNRVLLLACAAMLVATVGTVSIIRRDVVAPVTAPIKPAAPADAPNWYRLIWPFLPDGFDFVAATVADPVQALFLSVNPDTGATLQIAYRNDPTRAGDLRLVPNDPQGRLTESPWGYTLQTPDGVDAIVECRIGNIGSRFDDRTDYCAQTGVTREQLRALTRAVAATFPLVEIVAAAPTRGSGTNLDKIRAVMQTNLPDQVWAEEGGGTGEGDIVAFGYPGLTTGGTTVTVLENVYPPNGPTGVGAIRDYGKAAAGWSIKDGMAISVSAGGNQALDLARLQTLLAQVEQASRAPIVIPKPEPGCDTYTVHEGDYPAGVAQRYGVTPDDLLAVNPNISADWQVGAKIRIPCDPHPTARSSDSSGLDVFTLREHVQDPDFVVSNTLTVASDRYVWVVFGGATRDGLGAAAIFQYDRVTAADLTTGYSRIEVCAGPVEFIDDPAAALNAQPFRCVKDASLHLFDLFNGHVVGN